MTAICSECEVCVTGKCSKDLTITDSLRARFSATFRTDPEDHPASYKMTPGLFPGVKAAEAWR